MDEPEPIIDCLSQLDLVIDNTFLADLVLVTTSRLLHTVEESYNRAKEFMSRILSFSLHWLH